MKATTEKSMNCLCKYGNDLPIDTKKCPKCGLDLEPLSRIYQLSDRFIQQGDENRDLNRPGIALACYNAAQQVSLNDDPRSMLRSISLYLKDKNIRLAADLLAYAREKYPLEECWNDVEKQIIHEMEALERRERKDRNTRAGFYIASGLLVLMLAGFSLYTIMSKAGKGLEKPVKDYLTYYQERFAGKQELSGITVTADSLMHFSGHLNTSSIPEFWKILLSSDLSLSKVNIQGISMDIAEGGPLTISYVVRTGESLSKIASSVYNDPSMWQVIYNANRNLIRDKDLLKPGTHISIPIIKPSSNE